MGCGASVSVEDGSNVKADEDLKPKVQEEQLDDAAHSSRAKGMMTELALDSATFAAYMKSITDEFQVRTRIDKTEHRAITLQQLALVSECALRLLDRWSWRDTRTEELVTPTTLNLYHVNSWLIRPATSQDNCAFVELLATGDQPPEWFCSHWWGEPILDFISCVRKHVEIRQASSSDALPWAYWVCAYANRQHSLHEELTVDPTETSFFKAMQLAVGILVILDEDATPFRRLWCAFETYVALTGQAREHPMLFDLATTVDGIGAAVLTDGLTDAEKQIEDPALAAQMRMYRMVAFPLEVVMKGLTPELHRAGVSVASDRRHILNQIVGSSDFEAEPPGEHGEYDRINKRLGGLLARASFDKALKEGKGQDLGTAMQRDAQCTALQFDLSPLDPSDLDIANLGSALPPTLEQLEVRCILCERLSDVGLSALMEKLPEVSLRKLHLDLTGCSKISNEGLGIVALTLPDCRQLKELYIDATQCFKVSDGGLSLLAEGLQDCLALQALHLRFNSCSGISDRGLASVAAGIPPQNLLRLDLHFSYLRSITDAGLAAVALKLTLLTALTSLSLSVANCGTVSNVGLAVLAQALPTTLIDFQCDFSNTHAAKGHTDTESVFAQREPAAIRRWGEARCSTCNTPVAARPFDGRVFPLFSEENVKTDQDIDAEAFGKAAPSEGLCQVNFSEVPSSALPQMTLVIRQCTTWLRELVLNLPEDIDDETVGSLLPCCICLQWLELDFSGCKQVSSTGLASLAASFPKTLHQLLLSFYGCERIGDTGLSSLAMTSCSGQLQQLTLDFSDCFNITDVGVQAAAEGMLTSPALQDIKLHFSRCAAVSDAGLHKIAANMPQQCLHTLHLSLDKCRISNAGLVALADKVAQAQDLHQMRLVLVRCEAVSDDGLAALAAKLPEALCDLELITGVTKVSRQAQDAMKDGVDTLRNWGRQRQLGSSS